MSSHDAATRTGARVRATRDAAIVVCTRDRPVLLADALGAIRAAVPADVEVIVVDSGSTTWQTRAAADAADVRYVRSDVPGLSIARNVGLRATDRDIVVFTDDDCRVAPGFLTGLLAAFADADVLAAAGRLRDAASPPDDEAHPAPVRLEGVTAGLDAGHGALMAFRRTALLSLGGFDPLLGAGRRFGGAEDMDAFCRVLGAGGAVMRVPASIVTHVYTRDDADYVTLNASYGLGLGAMCAKWLRVSPRQGRALTTTVLRRGIVRLVRRLNSRRTRAAQFAFLRAVLTGLREARRLPLSGPTYTDTTPPAPVVLDGETSPEIAAERTTS